MSRIIREELEKVTELVREQNEKFYSIGVPEVPFPIWNAALLPDGRFVLSGDPDWDYGYGFSDKLGIEYRLDESLCRIVPVLVKRHRDVILRIDLERKRLWDYPMDNQGRFFHGVLHDCSDVVVDANGCLFYPGYELQFPLELMCGETLKFWEVRPIPCVEITEAHDGYGAVVLSDNSPLSRMEDPIRLQKLLSRTRGTAVLRETIEEEL